MNETTILLSSSPSSGDPKSELTKPDFLATVEPLVLQHRSSPASSSLFTLPFELIINEYTREPWSLGSSSRRDGEATITTIANNKKDNDDWISCYLVSMKRSRYDMPMQEISLFMLDSDSMIW
jgi:hypothetical protein